MSAGPAIVVLTASALPLARRLEAAMPGSAIHARRAVEDEGPETHRFDDAIAHLQELFGAGQPIVALMAAGIVIRALAPLLTDKRAEPPVLVVAEDGSVAVPLLGGHRGANELAREIAAATGGIAAITTASEVRLGFALDDPPPGWTVRNPAAVKPLTAALLAGQPVALHAEAGEPDWLLQSRVAFAPAAGLEIVTTDRDDPGSAERLVLHPRVLALGVGAERGTTPQELLDLALATLGEAGLAQPAIACVVSLDVKADEPAVQALAQALGIPARFFTAVELEAETPRLANPSEVVFEAVGCHGVAEGAALAAVGLDGELVVAKQRSERATCAIARAPAVLEPDTIGRGRGRLAVVGIGPGEAGWRTAEASALLADADDWVGYGGYLELLGTPPVKTRVHAFPLGAEAGRCRRALELAARGRRVVLVSSGDPGIYAMASLVIELLDDAADPAWRLVELIVSPGISALQAAAARVGAPIGHDVCLISLSDLLTPREVILGRLRAAAEADFVTALYNPASFRRRELLPEALRILAAARPDSTPVVLARNLGRPGEAVSIHTLTGFDPAAVDMLSLLIVGSSRTRMVPRRHGRPLVVTPRGYPLDEHRG